MKIVMIVTNSVLEDIRVMKEASELNNTNTHIIIYGLGEETKKGYTADGIEYCVLKLPRIGRVANKYTKDNVKRRNKSNKKGKNKVLVVAKEKVYLIVKGLYLLARMRRMQSIIYRCICKDESEIDIVHCHDLDTLIIGHKVKKRYNSKLYYDSHELWTEMTGINPLVSKRYKSIEKKLIREADTVFTVSDSIASELYKRYALSSRPLVLRNIPSKIAYIPKQRICSPDVIDIIYVGYYLNGRGIEMIVRSMDYVPDNIRLFLRISGNQTEISNLKKTVATMKHNKQIFVLPFVKQEDLLGEISNYDIGLISYEAVSLNNKYCLPNKLFQYLQAGVGIVSNKLPEVEALIKKYHCGLTYDNDDIELTFVKIISSLTSEQVKSFKKNAQIAIENELNWEKEKKVLLQAYYDI